MKSPYIALTELLEQNLEARETKNISRVLEWALKYYGAIDQEDGWHSDKFHEMPPMETILRELRNVKTDNGWKDEEAKKQEEIHRKKYSKKFVDTGKRLYGASEATESPVRAVIAKEDRYPTLEIPEVCRGLKGSNLSECMAKQVTTI